MFNNISKDFEIFFIPEYVKKCILSIDIISFKMYSIDTDHENLEGVIIFQVFFFFLFVCLLKIFTT